jgi:hypothetical protein
MNEEQWLVSTDPKAMLKVFGPSRATDYAARHSRLSDRKLRLYTCACARLVWGHLTNPWSCLAVEIAEDYVEGEATEEDLIYCFNRAPARETIPWPAFQDIACMSCACRESDNIILSYFEEDHDRSRDADFAQLLRDILGNPFQPLPLLHGSIKTPKAPWLTPQVADLAQVAYLERGMNGVLDQLTLNATADALEEAGCSEDLPCTECPVLEKARVGPDGVYDRDMTRAVIAWGKARRACRCGGTGKRPFPLLKHLRDPEPHYRGDWALDLVLGLL